MAYADLLKDPRWQKKRLKIFERDKFRCTECGSDKSTLHVHHIKYYGNPWEAPDDLLITFCEGCHELDESLKEEDSINKLSKATKPLEYEKLKKILNGCCYHNGNHIKFSDFVVEVYHG